MANELTFKNARNKYYLSYLFYHETFQPFWIKMSDEQKNILETKETLKEKLWVFFAW